MAVTMMSAALQAARLELRDDVVDVLARAADDQNLGKPTDSRNGFDLIDGLLGRSFLSRFDVACGAREWRIESK